MNVTITLELMPKRRESRGVKFIKEKIKLTIFGQNVLFPSLCNQNQLKKKFKRRALTSFIPVQNEILGL